MQRLQSVANTWRHKLNILFACETTIDPVSQVQWVLLTGVQREVLAFWVSSWKDGRGHGRAQRRDYRTGGGGGDGCCDAGGLSSLSQQVLDGVKLKTGIRQQDGGSSRDPVRGEKGQGNTALKEHQPAATGQWTQQSSPLHMWYKNELNNHRQSAHGWTNYFLLSVTDQAGSSVYRVSEGAKERAALCQLLVLGSGFYVSFWHIPRICNFL